MDELDLGLSCYDYAENIEGGLIGRWEAVEANVERVPLLADRWSFDPARMNEGIPEHVQGVAGEPAPLR